MLRKAHLGQRDQPVLTTLNWSLVLYYILFVSIGVINIYSAAYNVKSPAFYDYSQFYGKQFWWIIICLSIIIVILSSKADSFEKWAWFFYVMAIISLIAVLILGKEIKGNKAWFNFGFFSLQPSEFAKSAVCMALAAFLSHYSVRLKSSARALFTAFMIIFIPLALVILQDDAGSAIVFASLFLVLYVEGAPKTYFFLAILLATVFISDIFIHFYKIDIILVLLIAGVFIFSIIIYKIIRKKKIKKTLGYSIVSISFFLLMHFFVWENIFKDYQRQRIHTSFKLIDDKKNIGYNTFQSEIAIGSGGFLGKGYLQGTQTKGNFVPEQQTDFIFSTLAEEWGFVGSVIFIILYCLFLIEIIKVASRQNVYFARIYGFGVFSIFFVHFTINIAMVIGLMPVIGIPLPLVSYGGSSLLGFTILLFILIRLDASNKNTVKSRSIDEHLV